MIREVPISFSTVQPILRGEKTQTRRLPTSMWANLSLHHGAGDECRLWVREAHALVTANDPGVVLYRATWESDARATGLEHTGHAPRWRPPMYLPRKLSRITLLVTSVRIERVQDISRADVLAEGVRSWVDGRVLVDPPPGLATESFCALWNSLHTRPGTTWADNPEVYAIGFSVMTRPTHFEDRPDVSTPSGSMDAV